MSEIKHYLIINAPCSAVYQAIVQATGLQGWWTEDATAKPEVGSIAEFNFGERYHNEMKILRLELDRLVEWECIEGEAEWIGTKFLFTLEETDERTVLRFVHSDWRESTDFFASCNYHWGYYMRSLKLYCETGKGTPFILQDT